MPSTIQDVRPDPAVSCIAEHLSYFAVIARHTAIDDAFRLDYAAKVVAAVRALRRSIVPFPASVDDGPYRCIYCGQSCDLTNHEPYCSAQCGIAAANEG